MRSTVIALAAAIALLTSVAPALAMGGGTYQGPVYGSYQVGNESGGFDGTYEGSAQGGVYGGNVGGPQNNLNHTPVQGTIITAIGPIGFMGFFTGNGGFGAFSGKIWRASEPLTALAVGLGLLGVRFLRRR